MKETVNKDWLDNMFKAKKEYINKQEKEVTWLMIKVLAWMIVFKAWTSVEWLMQKLGIQHGRLGLRIMTYVYTGPGLTHLCSALNKYFDNINSDLIDKEKQ